MAVINTLKGNIVMSWFKHKPPKYPPRRDPPPDNKDSKINVYNMFPRWFSR